MTRAPPRPARLLPGAGDGTGITRHDAGLQVADIDAQLQGVGADNTHHLPLTESLFHFPPQVGKIAPPVARHELGVAGLAFSELVLQVFRQDFHVEAAGGEDDGLDVVGDKVRRHLARRRHRRLPDTELAVDDGGIEEDKGLRRRGGTAFVDQVHGTADDPLRVFLRIGHRGGTADEDGAAPVKAADPDQAPDHVGQVAAEDAAIDVEFVDNHVLQVGEELLPFRMMGENPRMEHVGIGDHHVPLFADRLAGIGGRVAVVGIGPDVRLHLSDKAVNFMHLILGEGLRGKHVEGAAFRLFKNALEHGKIVAEGFSARRGGDEDHVATPADLLDRLALVAVQLTDTPRLKDGTDLRMHPRGIGNETASERGNVLHRPDVLHETPVLLDTGDPLLHGELGHRRSPRASFPQR